MPGRCSPSSASHWGCWCLPIAARLPAPSSSRPRAPGGTSGLILVPGAPGGCGLQAASPREAASVVFSASLWVPGGEGTAVPRAGRPQSSWAPAEPPTLSLCTPRTGGLPLRGPLLPGPRALSGSPAPSARGALRPGPDPRSSLCRPGPCGLTTKSRASLQWRRPAAYTPSEGRRRGGPDASGQGTAPSGVLVWLRGGRHVSPGGAGGVEAPAPR